MALSRLAKARVFTGHSLPVSITLLFLEGGHVGSEKYARGAVDVHRIGGSRSLLVQRSTGQRTLEIDWVADAVADCRTFETLSEHAMRFARQKRWGYEPRESLERDLQRLADAGYLRSHSELCQGQAEESVHIKSLSVPSGDRAPILARSLGTFMDNFKRYEREVEVSVVDTSTTEGASKEYRDALSQLAADSGQKFRYANREDSSAFVEKLIGEGLDPETVRFALTDPEKTGQAYGTARNLVLLHNVDEAFASVDDDVECSIAGTPEPLPGVALFTGDGPGYDNYIPEDYWYFGSRKGILDAFPEVQRNALEDHEQILGKLTHNILSQSPEPRDMRDLGSVELVDAIAEKRARVLVTHFGLRGDAGWYTPAWYLLKGSASRDRLVASKEAYETACTSRELARVVPRTTLSDGRWFQSTFMGLDNRQMLPPTSPVMRYEDGVLRIMIHKMHLGGMVGYLPWMVLHNRPPGYPWSRESIWQPSGWTRTCEALIRCILMAQLDGLRDPVTRLRAIGQHLELLGSMPEADLLSLLAVETMHQKSMYIEYLQRLLDEHGGKPDFWADDIRKHIAAFTDAFAEPRFLVPKDLTDRGLSDEEAMTQFTRIVRQFGRVLQAWPDIVEAARNLRKRDCRLAQPLA